MGAESTRENGNRSRAPGEEQQRQSLDWQVKAGKIKSKRKYTGGRIDLQFSRARHQVTKKISSAKAKASCRNQSKKRKMETKICSTVRDNKTLWDKRKTKSYAGA